MKNGFPMLIITLTPILFVAIPLVILLGYCESPMEYQQKRIDEQIIKFDKNIGGSKHKVIVIDSCEYIVGWGGNSYGVPFLTHKGNCKYCLERNNK